MLLLVPCDGTPEATPEPMAEQPDEPHRVYAIFDDHIELLYFITKKVPVLSVR